MTPPNQPVRVVHHLACSGGTIMSRCLCAMPGVVLLSEIHPTMNMRRRSDPLLQAKDAYALVDDADLAAAFVREIRLVKDRCDDAGRPLIIRDHTSADFFADRFDELTTARVLADHFDVVRVCTVRHPIDAWLGMRAQDWMPLQLEAYCERFARFAARAAETGFERYEDFVLDPGASMERVCGQLAVPFAPDFLRRLDQAGAHLTGASGRQSVVRIEPRPRRVIDEATLDRFQQAESYRRAVATLGYAHPAGTYAPA